MGERGPKQQRNSRLHQAKTWDLGYNYNPLPAGAVPLSPGLESHLDEAGAQHKSDALNREVVSSEFVEPLAMFLLVLEAVPRLLRF